MKKVLVTGGAGFIGSTLIRQLLQKKYEVTVVDNLSTGLREYLPVNNNLKLISGDVRDFELVSTIIHGHEYVLHLAAQAFIPLSYQLPLQIAQTNSVGSLNVFQACLDHGVKRLVHISSSEIYGSARYTPMDENHPHNPESTYSVAKVAADLWAQTFYCEHNLPVVILRPFNTFGPRETLPYFIPEMIRQCFKEQLIRVGNLNTQRDFTYVDDEASAMMLALETEGLEGEIINLGTCKTWKMRKVLDLIKKDTHAEDKEVLIDENRLRPKDVTILCADNTKARKLLGWKPSIPFEKGLMKTVRWYKDNNMMWGYEKHRWQWRY